MITNCIWIKFIYNSKHSKRIKDATSVDSTSHYLHVCFQVSTKLSKGKKQRFETKQHTCTMFQEDGESKKFIVAPRNDF